MKRETIKGILYAMLLVGIPVLLGTLQGCKTQTVLVPVETVRTEYKDRLQRDSVHLYDSVYVDRFIKGDTVFLTKEKYKYLYRDKAVRDSVFVTDSIQVPYPVKGDSVYINHLYWWQTLLMALGGIMIGFFIYKIYPFIRRK